MQGMVGQPITVAVVRNGPPTNAFDMGDGRRAFQWAKSASYTTPTQVQNRGTASPMGNSVWWQQSSQITGGQTIHSECLYTLYGRWDDAAQFWRIEGFERPRFMCD